MMERKQKVAAVRTYTIHVHYALTRYYSLCLYTAPTEIVYDEGAAAARGVPAVVQELPPNFGPAALANDPVSAHVIIPLF